MNLSLLVTALIMSISNASAKDIPIPISGGRLRGTSTVQEYEAQATSNSKDLGYDSELLTEDHHKHRDDSTSEDYNDLTSESEDWNPEELPFLVAQDYHHPKCGCDNDAHCGNGYYCKETDCRPDPAYTTHKKCECTRDSDCPSGKYCKEVLCNIDSRKGISYGRCEEFTKKYQVGQCVKKQNTGPRVCDPNGPCNAASGDFDKCECSHNELCVRGIASCPGKGCCASDNEPGVCDFYLCRDEAVAGHFDKCECNHHHGEVCIKGSKSCNGRACCEPDYDFAAMA